MPILYAELQVAGRQVACDNVRYSFTQTTDDKGRPSSVVLTGLLIVTISGKAATWKLWPEIKFDPYRRESGHVVFFENEGITAKRYTFYDAALVDLKFLFDGRGTSGKQAAVGVELYFSAATIEVHGIRVENYSLIPWPTPPATSFKALTKPADPLPSAHLAAGLGLVVKKVGEAAPKILKEAEPIAFEGLARTITLLPGLLLTPTNSPDDPGYASEWELYKRNNHPTSPIPPPPKPDEVRLAELEQALAAQTLTAQEEAELIVLLAKVKGIHVQDLNDLDRAKKANSYRKGPAKKGTGNNPGRTGKQARLRELAKDDKLGSADRGWLNQEINSIQRKSKRQGRDGKLRPQKNIRNPPGKDLAHRRGERASKGFSYKTAVLQDVDLHHLEHKHEGYK